MQEGGTSLGFVEAVCFWIRFQVAAFASTNLNLEPLGSSLQNRCALNRPQITKYICLSLRMSWMTHYLFIINLIYPWIHVACWASRCFRSLTHLPVLETDMTYWKCIHVNNVYVHINIACMCICVCGFVSKCSCFRVWLLTNKLCSSRHSWHTPASLLLTWAHPPLLVWGSKQQSSLCFVWLQGLWVHVQEH